MGKQHIFIALILLFTSSCHSSKRVTKSQTDPSDMLTHTRWELSHPDKGESFFSNNLNKIHLLLNSTDNSITGFSGCNSFYGFYSIESESRISFLRISTSNLICSNEDMLYEESFLQKMESVTHYSINGEILTLKNKTEELTKLVKGNNYPNSLVEKHWKLKTINEKSVKMHEEQEREVFFRLRSDQNRVEGFSGCNHFQGTYSLEEQSKIRFNAMSSTKKACPNLHINEGEVFKIFELVDNYILVDDLLLFRTKDNRHLAEFEAIYFN